MIIDNELLAAYAEGNVSQQEREAVRQYLADNPDMTEAVLFAMEPEPANMGTMGHIDCLRQQENNNTYLDNLGLMLDEIESDTQSVSTLNLKPAYLPMAAMAAKNSIDRYCVIHCEGIAMRHFGIEVTDEELLQLSKEQGWLQSEGTALHNIGRLSGTRGLSVCHRYHCSIDDIREALSANNVVLAAVDSNELLGDYLTEQQHDLEHGLTPNHVVVVTEVTDERVTIIDSATPQNKDSYPLNQFIDAWNDSSNYLIIISNSDEYIPHPINLDDVEVEDELIELREAIAENAHEVWAETRRNEGWTYGPKRDDCKKHHPDMLPYNRLPESEKEYDRLMAMNTIKLVKKLGWTLTKATNLTTPKTNTTMEEKQQNTPAPSNERTYHCNDCGATIHKHEIFCPGCGKKLDHFDFED